MPEEDEARWKKRPKKVAKQKHDPEQTKVGEETPNPLPDDGENSKSGGDPGRT
jgi:hypothetical protein